MLQSLAPVVLDLRDACVALAQLPSFAEATVTTERSLTGVLHLTGNCPELRKENRGSWLRRRLQGVTRLVTRPPQPPAAPPADPLVTAPLAEVAGDICKGCGSGIIWSLGDRGKVAQDVVTPATAAHRALRSLAAPGWDPQAAGDLAMTFHTTRERSSDDPAYPELEDLLMRSRSELRARYNALGGPAALSAWILPAGHEGIGVMDPGHRSGPATGPLRLAAVTAHVPRWVAGVLDALDIPPLPGGFGVGPARVVAVLASCVSGLEDCGDPPSDELLYMFDRLWSPRSGDTLGDPRAALSAAAALLDAR